jgi:hypothetical protein
LGPKCPYKSIINLYAPFVKIFLYWGDKLLFSGVIKKHIFVGEGLDPPTASRLLSEKY